MKELQRHRDAFNHYLILKQKGEDTKEAIMSVACQQGVSDRTVYRWKDKLKWDDKEAVRASEINKEVEKKTNSTIVDNKSNYLSMIHNSFNFYLGEVKAGRRNPVEINNMNDFEKGVKTALLLQGESTERTEQSSQCEVSIHDQIKEFEEYYRQLEGESEGTD